MNSIYNTIFYMMFFSDVYDINFLSYQCKSIFFVVAGGKIDDVVKLLDDMKSDDADF